MNMAIQTTSLTLIGNTRSSTYRYREASRHGEHGVWNPPATYLAPLLIGAQLRFQASTVPSVPKKGLMVPPAEGQQ